MSDTTPPTIDGYETNAVSDIVDLRDCMYEPALLRLAPELPAPVLEPGDVLDQGQEGACTGFGLAAVINLLNHRAGRDVRVSPRMLYEMAKRHDEWQGEGYNWSSCRGAIKGWYNMGVCREAAWPYEADQPGELTIDRAKDAFNHTIGAYYRIKPDVVDFHAALNEVGAIYASARVHQGWRRTYTKNGRIPFKPGRTGGHCFAIVGYNAEGFWVQNSWGPTWGQGGLALWSYEDWKANIYDAWVFRLALPTPQIFPGRRSVDTSVGSGQAGDAPVRNEIMGHFVHLDDGRFDGKGRYWSSLNDVRQTAAHVAASPDYQHLLLYAHGGLNRVRASASRIKALKTVFKANGIYPFHFMYDTGLGEELRDVVLRREGPAAERMGGPSDISDWLLEKLTRGPGRAVWRQMKMGASSPFARRKDDGSKVLQAFVDAFKTAATPVKLHVAGHSTGAILQAHLLTALRRLAPEQIVETCSLLAPAASIALFESHYRPLLEAGAIARLNVYNLDARLELKDHVAHLYRKSLLWLVSNAFEDNRREPLLGMQRFSQSVDAAGLSAEFIYSQGARRGGNARTKAESHGGFDNDVATMNDLLKSILGRKPDRPFTVDDLAY
ncbi:C1 family peptidase [Synoicihabitans lomoniglobus]|uniref:C1 family peptidase n=1 Tax=Synoicihabitans lomoniglobus TaxID=2909285 RepID=A0AAE9ZX63_9BACT|nr:C1 family peptidase [Opitutaceae bacterium LMO-M01]WED64839.1 C1 family peptidase [Opitutaceae bacterium LMO-M01]